MERRGRRTRRSAVSAAGLAVALIATTLAAPVAATAQHRSAQGEQTQGTSEWVPVERQSYDVEPDLDRGVVALNQGEGRVYVGWRLLEADHDRVGFHVYRETDGRKTKLTRAPVRESTNLVDTTADLTKENTYTVQAVGNGAPDRREATYTLGANSAEQGYLAFDLADDIDQTARHIATGDLDGDGDLDFVIKRGNQNIDPSKGEEPTDTYKLEGYTNEGEFLWRRDLGVNLRTGIWYTPYVVADLNGDGKAEVAYKSSEVDEDLNGDGRTDYRGSANWRVYEGPEYVEILEGATGQTLHREDWIDRGEPGEWGDEKGNRSERQQLAVAYTDGEKPSLIVMRGIYAQMKAEAWDFHGEEPVKLWSWLRPRDEQGRYAEGMGYHNIRTGDVDGDGRDELINGSVAIDDDGTTLWITGEGHGDRLHMTDIDPTRPGLEIFYVQEVEGHYEHPIHLRDAATGELIWGIEGEKWADVGRGSAADIDPTRPGLEVWSGRPDPTGATEIAPPTDKLYDATGDVVGTRPYSVNYGIWWDGDLLRESLDGVYIDKWDYENEELVNLVTAEADPASGTERYSVLGYGDVIGDWREEVFYVHDASEVRIYTTTIPTEYRFPTFLQDKDYRSSLASESSGYMQSTQPGFYFGAESAPNR